MLPAPDTNDGLSATSAQTASDHRSPTSGRAIANTSTRVNNDQPMPTMVSAESRSPATADTAASAAG